MENDVVTPNDGEEELTIDLPQALLDALVTLWVRDHGLGIWGDPVDNLRAYEGPDVPYTEPDPEWLRMCEERRVRDVYRWQSEGLVDLVILQNADRDITGILIELPDGHGLRSYLEP